MDGVNVGGAGAVRRDDPGLRRLIPVTEIRHFYRLLRDTLVSTEVHLALATELASHPERLGQMVARSREHFLHYDNRVEGFRPGSGGGAFTDDLMASDKAAHEVLRRIRQYGVQVPVCPELAAGYVDYEVSPIRTTGSWFEQGDSGERSGRGGLDILLANSRDSVPVVAEVKWEKDRNLFLGLVQSLTYAVELSTPHQRERLEGFYPGRFARTEDGTVLDIYLLVVGVPPSSHHSTFLELVNRISLGLVKPGGAAAGILRRIACLKTESPGPNPTHFGVEFIHPVVSAGTSPEGK